MQTAKRPLILDGGLGTLLYDKYKCNTTHKLWSSLVMENNPEIVYKAHKEFCDAGADIIITCTYTVNLERGFDGDQTAFENNVRRSIEVAKNVAVDHEKETGKKIYVAGSCGTYANTLFMGKEFTGDYLHEIENEQEKIDFLIKYHKDRFEIIDSMGCDIIAFETIPSAFEGNACSQVLAKGNTPGWVTFSQKDENHIANGDSIEKALLSLTFSPNLVGVGFNCVDLNFCKNSTEIVKKFFNDPRIKAGGNVPQDIVIYPNSGEIYMTKNQWSTKEDIIYTLKDISDLSVEWYEAGATIIGGCCKVTPGEIQQIAEKFNNKDLK